MDYPSAIVPTGHVEPVPRRIRAVLDGRRVVDTIAARYVWEWPFYPQYYLPQDDVAADVLAELVRSEVARTSSDPALVGHVHLPWDSLDAWFEEGEQVFVHPRNPYTRVDALRSDRRVRVELDGVLLAESSAPVLVFETGLPTRYYVDRSCVNFEPLVPSATQTPCPYKGRTSEYWSVRTGTGEHADLAWSYDFPTRELLAIAGLVCFYNEKVDITLDGVALPRPDTHFG